MSKRFSSRRGFLAVSLAAACLLLSVPGIGIADEYRDGVLVLTERPLGPVELGDVVRRLPSPSSSTAGLAWDGESLWASGAFDEMIYQIDPKDGTVIHSYRASILSLRDLEWKDGFLWVSSWASHEIFQLVPEDGTIVHFFPAPFPGPPNGIAWVGDSLWIGEEDGLVYQVDPVDGTILDSFVPPAGGSSNPRGLAWDGQHLWVGYQSVGLIYKLGVPGGDVLDSFESPAAGFQQSVAWDGQFLWASRSGAPPILYQIDVEAAALSVDVSGTCPGEVTLTVTTVRRSDRATLFTSPDEGVSHLPPGHCAGTELDLVFPHRWRRVKSNENGIRSFTREVSSSWCGRYVQAVDRSCSTSNVARFP